MKYPESARNPPSVSISTASTQGTTVPLFLAYILAKTTSLFHHQPTVIELFSQNKDPVPAATRLPPTKTLQWFSFSQGGK